MSFFNDENSTNIFGLPKFSTTSTQFQQKQQQTAQLQSARVHQPGMTLQQQMADMKQQQQQAVSARPLSSRAPLGSISNNLINNRPQATQQSTTAGLQKQYHPSQFLAKPVKQEQAQQPQAQVLQSHQHIPAPRIEQFRSVDQSNSSAMSDIVEDEPKAPDSPGIDRRHQDDPQQTTEYLTEIYEHFKNTERKYMPDHRYMDKHPDITSSMRSILVDWLIEVHYKFRLRPETLYLTVNIVDRFLAEKAVLRNKLQLVGIAALLLASKYEEIIYPDLEQLLEVTDKAYSREELLKMERLMLATLNFNLTVPTPYSFLSRYLKAAASDYKHYYMVHYILELQLIDYSMLQFEPSLIAASAVYLARKLFGREEAWTTTLEYYSKFKVEDLKLCTQYLFRSVYSDGRTKLQSVQKKFSRKSRLEVARLAPYLIKLHGVNI